MEYSCIQLFPKSFLNKLFNFSTGVLNNLLYLWKEAINNFLENNLAQLDPLVCENSCHIRALLLNNMAIKYTEKIQNKNLRRFSNSLERLITDIERITPSVQDHKLSIIEFIQAYSLDFNLESSLFKDLKFLISCHILTLTKKNMPSADFTLNEKTCHKKILATGLVHNKTKSLVLETQKELSLISCQYVLEILKDNNEQDTKIFKDGHGRSYLPQHVSGKVFLTQLLDPNKIIVLEVSRFISENFYDKVIYFLQFDTDKHTLTEINHIDESRPCVVLAGVVNYKHIPETPKQYIERIKSFSIEHIFEANFAAHPQFSGSLRDEPCIYDDNHNEKRPTLFRSFYLDYKTSKNFAETNGCTKESPALLFLNHIYCDIAKTFINNSHDLKLHDNLPSTGMIEPIDTK
tara:strand:- start:102 stop:1316 length:1215 start_codon:yes stop_codon:yes gene_type:complete